jgi:phosphotransacetylase/acyl dehydratase
MTNIPFDAIQPGLSATLTRTLCLADIQLFAVMSGDVNPAQVDAAFAADDSEHQVVAHGMWGATLISTLLGTELPGPGSILQSQSFDYLAPVHIGDTVIATVRVIGKDAERRQVSLDCMIVNQHGVRVMNGRAEVIASNELVSLEPMRLPTVEMHESGRGYRKLVAMTAGMAPLRTAVIHPVDVNSLTGAIEAARAGLIVPVLVGPIEKIRKAAAAADLDLAGIEMVNTEHSDAAAEAGAAMAGEGRVEALMKGALHTDELMHAVLAPAARLRTKRRMSHVFAIDAPTYPRALFITDAALNLYPELNDKRDIVQNAIELAHALGIALPRVALLSAVETVNADIRSTLDAAALCKMAERGQITGGVLDGPLAFDNAVSAEAAATKGIVSAVAGLADILLVPDVESGNMLAKQLEYLGGAEMAGIVLGARVPIILTSRADKTMARLGSCAIALLLARHKSGAAK